MRFIVRNRNVILFTVICIFIVAVVATFLLLATFRQAPTTGNPPTGTDVAKDDGRGLLPNPITDEPSPPPTADTPPGTPTNGELYRSPTPPVEVVPPPVVSSAPSLASVMMLDNTAANWSHEYPTAFVKEYNGAWSISPDHLYLTFDCGYDYNNLAAMIMDTLRVKGVKAVFFVTGDFMNDRPDLVRRMVAEGYIVGNHSYAHLNQPQNLGGSIDTVVADIRAWENRYREIMGAGPSTMYFRPPGGTISRRSMALMQLLGYRTLMWGVAYKDWDTSAQPSRETAMSLLRRYTTAGDIVLLHGVSQTSSDILAQYIDEYRGKGFTFTLP